MVEDREELSKMFKEELKIKDKIVVQLQEKIGKIDRLNQQLTMKLQIPRTHMIFLKENGKLEEFVEAKLLGKEPVAKWLLMDTNKRDIDII